MDEDVLAGTPLPGWSLFDALFFLHREPATSPASSNAEDLGPETPLARIQKLQRRAVLLLACCLLLSTASRWSRYGTSSITGSSNAGGSIASTSQRGYLSNLLSHSGRQRSSWHPTRPPSRRPTGPQLPPLRLRTPASRLGTLRSYAQARKSSFSHSLFFSGQDGTISESDQQLKATVQPLANHLVTAVIVHDSDWHIENTQLVIDTAARYPFVREILVWNNDIDLQIDGKTLTVPEPSELGFDPPTLRVLNAPSSFSPLAAPVHRTLPASHAKHLACGVSNHRICLFLSPASLPIHLDSLYSSYLSTGPAFNQIVSVVNAEEFYRLQHLAFDSESVDLHTGALFPVLASASSTGNRLPSTAMHEAIVHKDYSRRFWKQLGTLSADVTDQADIYWSLWMNTLPKLLVAPYLPFTELETQSTKEDKEYQDSSVMHALRLLYGVLKAQDPFLSPDPFPLAPSPPPSDTRAPSHDDRAVFITNLTPFRVQAGELSFSGSGALFGKAARSASSDAGGFNPEKSISSLNDYIAAWRDRASAIQAQAQDGFIVFPASKEEFKFGLSWYAAVNGRHPDPSSTLANSTCWLTPSSPVKGDYFGLNFLQPISLEGKSVTLTGSKLLGNLVGAGEEDLTAESWEVWTKAGSIGGQRSRNGASGAEEASRETDWIRRKLQKPIDSQKIGEGPFWRHTFTLSPLPLESGSLSADETEDGALEGDEHNNLDDDGGLFKVRARKRQLESSSAGTPDSGREVGSIKLVSRDRKSQRVRVCGWQIGDWVI